MGAIVLWPTKRRRERAAAAETDDPEDRPARLRERLTAVETTLAHHSDLLEGRAPRKRAARD